MLSHTGIVLVLHRWHIHYILVLDYYPLIEGNAIFHSDQLHAAIYSPKFNLILFNFILQCIHDIM